MKSIVPNFSVKKDFPKIIFGKMYSYLEFPSLLKFSKTVPGGFDYLVAVGAHSEIICGEQSSFDLLKSFYEIKKDWIFGYFSCNDRFFHL